MQNLIHFIVSINRHGFIECTSAGLAESRVGHFLQPFADQVVR